MRASPTRHRVAFAIALIGVAVSAFIFVIHRRIAGDPGYTSFCNLGGAINCDAVIGSQYGTLLGVSVAAWSVLAFGVGGCSPCPEPSARPRVVSPISASSRCPPADS